MPIYVLILILTFVEASDQFAGKRSWNGIAAMSLSLLVVVVALWFFSLQKFLLHAWCKVCLATHACAVLGVLFTLASAFKGNPGACKLTPHNTRLGVFGAMLGVAILVIGQTVVQRRAYTRASLSNESGSAARQLILHSGKIRLNLMDLPRIGSGTATKTVVCMFDYTCDHCRALRRDLRTLLARRTDVAVFTLPVPLDAACNPAILITAAANRDACEYARLALAVWRAKAESFQEFDESLFASNAPPPIDRARLIAQSLVGKPTLEMTLQSKWVGRQLDNDIELYMANSKVAGNGFLPQLIIGNRIISGVVEDANDLLNLIDTHP